MGPCRLPCPTAAWEALPFPFRCAPGVSDVSWEALLGARPGAASGLCFRMTKLLSRRCIQLPVSAAHRGRGRGTDVLSGKEGL